MDNFVTALPTVNATQVLRKMRGASQAQLMQADDGRHYVVKLDTPANRRALVNEFLAGLFLEHLGLNTTEMAVVQMNGGKHFGSGFPGDPEKTVAYDFIPDPLLRNVENRREFAGLLAFDKWVGNEDFRQCVFVKKARLPRSQFQAIWIDNGNAFGGSEWEIVDNPRQGLYLSSAAYEPIQSWSDFEPWLEALQRFPEELVEQAIAALPSEWVAGEVSGERDRLRRLMDRLLLRRSKVADHIERTIESKPEAFPNWKRHSVPALLARKGPHSVRLVAAPQVA
jgi:hypothetical protein